jgi:hypothetical protein
VGVSEIEVCLSLNGTGTMISKIRVLRVKCRYSEDKKQCAPSVHISAQP